MEFRVATEQDFEFVNANPLFPQQIDKNPPERLDYDYVLTHGDYIIGAGGFRIITSNACAWSYVMLTTYVGHHVIVAYRCISEWLEVWCKEHKITRLQAWVDVEFEEGHRMVDHLDFRKDCRMRNFLGKGKDAILYARIFDE